MKTTDEIIEESFDNNIRYKERKRWVFFGLPFTFTKYTITDSVLTIDKGFFKTTEDDCYMYKIQDVQHTATLGEKMFGLGTVKLYCGDVTTPDIVLMHVKNSKEIKNYLLKASEAARLKRRTLNVNDIGVGAAGIDLDGDGIIDNIN